MIDGPCRSTMLRAALSSVLLLGVLLLRVGAGSAPFGNVRPTEAASRNLGARLRDHVDSLVYAGGTRSRVVFTPGNDRAVEYILRTMRRDLPGARLDTFRVRRRGTRSLTPVVNVVAVMPGRTDSLLVICAHLDASADRDRGWSTNWKEMIAPGADDNATGVAALLETLTLARHAPGPPRYTTMFVACNAEERHPDYAGLSRADGHHLGSRHVAQRLKREGRAVRGVIVLDMVGYRPDRAATRLFASGASGAFARELLAVKAWLRLPLEIPSRLEPCSRSDNESFERLGFPTALFMESCAPWRSVGGQPRNPAYHSRHDLPSIVNYNVLEGVTRLVTAYVIR